MGRWIGSNEYNFNMAGKIKCDYCGSYYEDNLSSHGCQAEKRALAGQEEEE